MDYTKWKTNKIDAFRDWLKNCPGSEIGAIPIALSWKGLTVGLDRTDIAIARDEIEKNTLGSKTDVVKLVAGGNELNPDLTTQELVTLLWTEVTPCKTTVEIPEPT